MKEGSKKILCVDDDQDVLDSLRTVLESNSYTMIEAHSGEEGLKVFKKQKPDLIIADLMMEEVDAGMSFVKDLRAQGNKAPIYMLSSVGDQLNQTTSYSEYGLSGVFQKPVNFTTLLQTLKTKLG